MDDLEWNATDRTRPCPQCQAPNNCWGTSDGEAIAPTAGALSMCFECGALGVFTDDAEALRATTPEEEAEFAEHPAVMRARTMLSYTDSPRLAAALMAMDA